MRIFFIVLSVMMFLSACDYAQVDYQRLDAMTSEINSRTDELRQVTEQLTQAQEKLNESVAQIAMSDERIEARLMRIDELYRELENLEARVAEVVTSRSYKQAGEYWSGVKQQVRRLGGYLNFYASNNDLSSSFNSFVTERLRGFKNGHTPKNISLPVVTNQPEPGRIENRDFEYLKKNFQEFYFQYGKDPAKLKSFCESFCSIFYGIALDEQKTELLEAMVHYEKLLKVSQQSRFQELAQAIVTLEAKTNDWNHPSVINARKLLKQSYPDYSLFELQAAYRHFSKSYNAWSELLSTAKHEFGSAN